MADLGSRIRNTMADQASNQKFLQLLHSNRRIDTLRQRQIVSSIGLADFNPTALPAIKKQKLVLKARSKSQVKIKQPLKARPQRNNGLKHQLKNEAGIRGTRVQSSSKLSRDRNKSYDSIKQTPNTQLQKLSTKFITPHKISVLGELSSMAKKTNKTLIQEIPTSEPLENIMLNVKFGKIQDGISYRAFLKKELEPSPAKIIERLGAWLLKFKIKSGLIQTVNLEAIFRRKSIPNDLILKQFNDYTQMRVELMKAMPGLQYYDEAKPKKCLNLAAAKIQSLFRMNLDRNYTRKLKSLMKKVLIIQQHWRRSLARRRIRERVMANMVAKIERSKQLTEALMSKWETLKTSPRIEIHICSISIEEFKRLSFSNLRQRESSQLTRVFRALETDITVIFVMPSRMKGEVFRYYERLFALDNRGAIFRERLTFITLEELSEETFPYMTSASLLLYSCKQLQRIKQIVRSSPHSTAYIVPSYPSNQLINLSVELGAPLFSGPMPLYKLYSSKSGHFEFMRGIQKHLGQKCPFSLPVSASDVYSEKELMRTLSVLIFKHPSIAKWYLKIDDEINNRGLALLNVNSLNFIKELHRQTEVGEVSSKQLIQLISSELEDKLRSHLKIFNKAAYASPDQFLSHFITRGGFIQEAVGGPQETYLKASQGHHPRQHSISFLIEPNGDFSLLGTYSRLEQGGRNVDSAIKVPSDLTVQQVDNEVIVRALYRQLWGKQKLFGYFTVDLLYISQRRVYVIGFDCFLNEKTCAFFVPQAISRCAYNKESNTNDIQCPEDMHVKSRCISSMSESRAASDQTDEPTQVEKSKRPLHYIYCPLLKLKGLPAVHQFFKRCKFGNIEFDVQKKLGTLFMLVDSLEHGCIGLLVSSASLEGLLHESMKVIDFISREFSPKSRKAGKKGQKAEKTDNNELGQLRGVLLNWKRRLEKSNPRRMKEDLNLQMIF